MKNLQPETSKAERRTGFTFLELLLVIAIIAILLGMTIPLVSKSIRNTFFNSFVNKTYLFFDYASTQATLRNKAVETKFDPQQNYIFLREYKKNDKVISQMQIPDKINIGADKETVVFYPDGTLEEFKVVISDDQKREAEISSAGFDGKLKLR
jgi:prepilin-type N-terminal cleavage/methylation domain-containing protein